MRAYILLLALCATIYAGCASSDLPEADALLVSATDVGKLETNANINGRDGGYSAVYKGKSVWLYGDTVLSVADARGRNWLNNSWSYTEDLNASDGITGFSERLDSAGAATEFFPQTKTETTFNDAHYGANCAVPVCGARWAVWPGAIVADEKRDRALIFYVVVYAEPGDMNFAGIGKGLALWSAFDDSPQRLTMSENLDHPDIMFSKDEPSFGSAVVVVGEDLYVYACDLESLRKPCKLARVPLADALDRFKWKYYAGGAVWSDKLADATDVMNGNDIMTVYYNKYLQRYVAVFSQTMDVAVMMRTSLEPEGPWSGSLLLFNATKPAESDWVYDALAHPEYDQEDGRFIYVTYSRGTGFLSSERRVVKVELQKKAQ